MPAPSSDLANFIGTHVLPFTNPRVVCPPGRIQTQGQLNIIVATPMRSGTHILIDLILNNLSKYRNRPLYIDLDQCIKQSRPGHDLLQDISLDAGYVIKTHMPLGTPAATPNDPHVLALIEAAQVLTIRRDKADVCRSLGRWHKLDAVAAEARYGPDYDHFWKFWDAQEQISIEFTDLFKPDRMKSLLGRLASSGKVRTSFLAPPSDARKSEIYFNKMLTRLLGRHAPRIDTTIHTLKN